MLYRYSVISECRRKEYFDGSKFEQLRHEPKTTTTYDLNKAAGHQGKYISRDQLVVPKRI